MKKLYWIIVFFIAVSMIFSFVACTPTSTNNDKEEEFDFSLGTTTLGNGNYVMHNYMSHTYGSPVNTETTDEKIEIYLQRAEVYNKGMIDDFAASLKGRPDAQAYFNQFINDQKGIEYKQDNLTGMDPVITEINGYCKPIFVDMIETLDNHIDRTRLIRYIELIGGGKVYKNAFGDDFGRQSTHFNPKEDYEFTKKNAIDSYNYVHKRFGVDVPFDIQNDFENNNCRQITNGTDQLCTKIAQKKGGNFTAADFCAVINYATNAIYGGDAMHDYFGDVSQKHRSCVPVEEQGTIIDTMLETAETLYYAEQEQQNGMSM